MPDVVSPPQPVAFTVSVKTEPSERWSSGTRSRTTTITPTPIMCQYAEIVFSMAVTLTLSRFRSSAPSRTTAYVR